MGEQPPSTVADSTKLLYGCPIGYLEGWIVTEIFADYGVPRREKLPLTEIISECQMQDNRIIAGDGAVCDKGNIVVWNFGIYGALLFCEIRYIIVGQRTDIVEMIEVIDGQYQPVILKQVFFPSSIDGDGYGA
ncbi:MAG: hypothetical protein J6A88_02885 [Oscillospiraceae bacterium]|nr:hypothetical protein [Oscillospiraceae bacterium]